MTNSGQIVVNDRNSGVSLILIGLLPGDLFCVTGLGVQKIIGLKKGL
jgi:hypothetical protein